MSDRRGRGGRERWASDHERARQRAAERLSLPLPASENAWLDHHLARCSSCASVVAEYVAQQAALHALREPIPPRDLWPRTAAALDRAERQGSRDVPNPSVFPGRGGQPGSRGARSIRALRAERRASAFRSTPHAMPYRRALERRRPAASGGIGWVAPFGALAGLALVIVIGGTTLLTQSTAVTVPPPAGTARPSLAVTAAALVATPIPVGAGEVAWLTPSEDGTYNLNFGSVDQVCPATAAPDCAPIASTPARQLRTVTTTAHTVLRNPAKTQLVVVTRSKSGRGASLIVVAVPTPAPSGGTATAVPQAPSETPASVSPAPVATATVGTDATPPPSAAAAAGGTEQPSDTPVATAVGSEVPASPTEPVQAPGSTEPGGTVGPTSTGSPSASPSDASSPPSGSESLSGTPEPVAASDVPTLSPEPSASVDASGLAPGTPEPTATAQAIISDVVIVGETAAYSSDGTMLAFSARPIDNSHGPDIYLWRAGEPSARPLTSDHASIFSGWLGGSLLGSRVVDAAGVPVSSAASPSISTAPSASDVVIPDASAAAVGGAIIAFLFGAGRPNAEGAATISFPFFGPAAASAEPSVEAAPSASDQPNAEASATSSATDLATPSSPVESASATPDAGITGQSFVLDPISGVETFLPAPAWRPVVDPTGRFVAYWAGTLRYDPASLTWLADRGVLALASWPAFVGSDPAAVFAPVPLLDSASAGVPSGEWDIRWDETGTHLGIWTADAGDPNVGSLSLLTVDQATATIDPTGIALPAVPALPGFSIGNDRLAWATPPGQDGEGSRVQVLAWSGENAGKIDSQPASGNDAVIVVR